MAGPPVGADEPEQVRGWVTTVAIDCNRGYDAAYVRASLWPTDHAALGTDQACRARRRGRPTTRGTTKESWHGHPVQAPPTPQASLARRDVGADPGVAGVEVDLPAWGRLPRHLPGPRAGHDEQRAVPPAPGEGEAARPQADLHLLPGRALVLPVHPAHDHRDLPDVLLPPDRRSRSGARLQRHAVAVDHGVLRPAHAKHAPMGRPPDGLHGVPAHGPGLLPRRLQAAARVQLGGRRGAAALGAAAVVHRLPAALGPAGDLGGVGGDLDDGLHAGDREPGPLRAAGVGRDRTGHADPLVRAACARAAIRGDLVSGGPLLAHPQGRRLLRAAVALQALRAVWSWGRGCRLAARNNNTQGQPER